MAKLKMMIGLPASGKSTRAAELVETGGWKRVNRDLIRTMLHFDKFNGKNEDVTVTTEMAIARNLLGNGISVVVDDCNLNPKNREMWKSLAKDMSVEFETEVVKTSWEICVARDEVRDKSVGKSVIKNMALQYESPGTPFEDIVICDIDGTVADTKHRIHFLQQQPKDWKGFFGALAADPVRPEIAAMVIDDYNKGRSVIYVSGRPDTYRKETEDWLAEKSLGFSWTLLMRRGGDSRPDTIVKQEIYNRFLKGKSIVKVYDDRPSVIRMWRENGLEVLDVGDGVEF